MGKLILCVSFVFVLLSCPGRTIGGPSELDAWDDNKSIFFSPSIDIPGVAKVTYDATSNFIGSNMVVRRQQLLSGFVVITNYTRPEMMASNWVSAVYFSGVSNGQVVSNIVSTGTNVLINIRGIEILR